MAKKLSAFAEFDASVDEIVFDPKDRSFSTKQCDALKKCARLLVVGELQRLERMIPAKTSYQQTLSPEGARGAIRVIDVMRGAIGELLKEVVNV